MSSTLFKSRSLGLYAEQICSMTSLEGTRSSLLSEGPNPLFLRSKTPLVLVERHVLVNYECPRSICWLMDLTASFLHGWGYDFHSRLLLESSLQLRHLVHGNI